MEFYREVVPVEDCVVDGKFKAGVEQVGEGVNPRRRGLQQGHDVGRIAGVQKHQRQKHQQDDQAAHTSCRKHGISVALRNIRSNSRMTHP